MELEKNQDNIYLTKALKYYLNLKENENNEKHGIGYANKTLNYLNMIKNKNKYNKVIADTENYCNNFITYSCILIFSNLCIPA